ncbi:MAG: hypothetical protein JNJ88_05445 [Planctomycetes bacterium]|nr:hypothetical protein [Planctomycetota bacterium]
MMRASLLCGLLCGFFQAASRPTEKVELEGVVLDPVGNPMTFSSAHISLYSKVPMHGEGWAELDGIMPGGYRWVRETEINRRGRFRFKALDRGEYLVEARHRCISSDSVLDSGPLRQLVTVAAGRNCVELAMGRGMQICGRVVNEKGEPFYGGYISCVSTGGDWRAFGSVERGGRFAFGPLPLGIYYLWIHPQEVTPPVPIRTYVIAGESSALVVAPAGAKLRAHFQDEQGNRAAGSATLVDQEWSVDRPLCLEMGGASFGAEFWGVQPGTYLLRAESLRDELGLAGPLELRGGSSLEDLRVVVRPAEKLSLAVDSDMPGSVQVALQASAGVIARFTIRPGDSKEVLVPKERIHVRARRIDLSDPGRVLEVLPTRFVDASEGSPEEVIFTLR